VPRDPALPVRVHGFIDYVGLKEVLPQAARLLPMARPRKFPLPANSHQRSMHTNRRSRIAWHGLWLSIGHKTIDINPDKLPTNASAPISTIGKRPARKAPAGRGVLNSILSARPIHTTQKFPRRPCRRRCTWSRGRISRRDVSSRATGSQPTSHRCNRGGGPRRWRRR